MSKLVFESLFRFPLFTYSPFFFFNVTLAGLVSDAFHLTFGCGLLTFSLFAMATSRKKPDHAYSYGLEYF